MKVYKLKDTTEPGVVVMRIGSKTLSNSDHDILEKISGDLFLIFPESVTSHIDPAKFSRLYGATWYGVYSEDPIKGIWEALDYLETLTKYTSYSVVNSGFWIKEETFGALKRLQYSGIETSVFEYRNLKKEEKAKIYTIKPRIIEILWGWRFKWFGRRDLKGMYSARTTNDPILFLRPSSIRKLRDTLSPDILHSFYGLEIGSFFASLITPLNLKIDEAKV